MSADDFFKLSKALKQAGEKDLRKALHKGLRDAVKKHMPEAQRALGEALPGGDLAARGSQVKQVAKVKTGKDPSVTVAVQYGKRGRGLGASNARLANTKGQIRHPLYGNRDHWFNTPAPSALGWFDKTWTEKAPEVRDDLSEVVQSVIDDIVRRAR